MGAPERQAPLPHGPLGGLPARLVEARVVRVRVREEAQEAYKILREGAERSGINLDFEQEKGSSVQPHEPPSQYAALLKENGMSRQAGYACQNCEEVRVAHVGSEGRPASEERTH